jgi:hypothetical protein
MIEINETSRRKEVAQLELDDIRIRELPGELCAAANT